MLARDYFFWNFFEHFSEIFDVTLDCILFIDFALWSGELNWTCTFP